ncbi:MAG: hypothetical protein NTZ68_04215 [Candidatus Dependentiae bacterium]|nr:hypothetical protein [Candidatus Dependentiae bacterium]
MTENKKEFVEPVSNLEVIFKDGLPVSIVLSVEDFERMTSKIATAEELFEGKDLFMPDGQKVTFEEMADKRFALECIDRKADLDSCL